MKRIGMYVSAVFLAAALLAAPAFPVFADAPADRPPRCTVCDTGTMLTITRRETITSRHPCMHGHEGYDGMAKYDENTYCGCNTCHYGARTASVYVGESFMYCECAVS